MNVAGDVCHRRGDTGQIGRDHGGLLAGRMGQVDLPQGPGFRRRTHRVDRRGSLRDRFLRFRIGRWGVIRAKAARVLRQVLVLGEAGQARVSAATAHVQARGFAGQMHALYAERAERAGVPPERIVTTWPLERLREWTARAR